MDFFGGFVIAIVVKNPESILILVMVSDSYLPKDFRIDNRLVMF